MTKAQIFPDIDEAKRDRLKVAALVDQTVDAMPDDTDPEQRPDVAMVLIGQTLASAVRHGLLPVRRHAASIGACRSALGQIPDAGTLAEFQTAAKAALRDAVTAEG